MVPKSWMSQYNQEILGKLCYKIRMLMIRYKWDREWGKVIFLNILIAERRLLSIETLLICSKKH